MRAAEEAWDGERRGAGRPAHFGAESSQFRPLEPLLSVTDARPSPPWRLRQSASVSSSSASMSLPSTVPTCTSDHKRKRPPLASSSSRDSAFSTATGKRLVEVYGTAACWHCGASPADAVHVITTRDYHIPTRLALLLCPRSPCSLTRTKPPVF